MADTLDDKMKEHPQQEEPKKEAPKPKTTLESVIGETVDAIKAGLNLGVGMAAPAAGYAWTGNLGVPVVSAAFIAGSGGSLSSKKIRQESLGGAIWATFLHYFTAPVKYLSSLGKAAYMAMLPLSANVIYPTIDNAVKARPISELKEKLEGKNYWSRVRKSFALVWPIATLSAIYFPPAYTVASIGVANYLYRKFVAGHKAEEDKNEDKTPYRVAAPNAASKLVRNASVGMYDALSAIGNSVSDLYKASPKKAAPAGGHA